MTYELAKQLKDAGFPQFVGDFQGEIIEDPNAPKGEEPISCYKPTLSELIEACGEEFRELRLLRTSSENKWQAEGIDYSPQELGKTPEEAVARLWLALNRHQ